MDEDEKMVNEIKDELVQKLNTKFNYCGIAINNSDKFIMLNSGKGNIKIKITWE